MVQIEVRGGEGGGDATHFAEQITNSIFHWLQKEGWKTEYVSGTSLTVEVQPSRL